MIPEFENGSLPVGKHRCTTTEFLERFCNTEYRKRFQKSLSDVFDYCKDKGASRLIIGGSYVTEKDCPSDFDCVIVFPQKELITAFSDSAVDGEIAFDILFASEDNPKVVDSYIALFTNTRTGTKRGVVEIIFDSSEPWQVQYHYNDEELNVVRRAYANRTIIERKEKRGILVSIHGVNTDALWNAEMAPIVSSQGWIFAPFVYDNPKRLLVCNGKREEIIQEFRNFVYRIYDTYKLPVSVVAHSFGTYIICRYLRDCGNEYVEFDSIILTGGIVDEKYDWPSILKDKAGAALNIYTKSDKAVWWMPPHWLVSVFSYPRILDSLFGKCGIKPFEKDHADLMQQQLDIIDHCHVFQKDFMNQTMMPFLISHLNGYYAKALEKLTRERNQEKITSPAIEKTYPTDTNLVSIRHGEKKCRHLEI